MPYDDLHCSFDKVTRCVELGIHVLVDDSPVNIARARDAGIVAATIVHPWNVELVERDGVIGAPDWTGAAGEARPRARPDRLTDGAPTTASAAGRRSGCDGAAACVSWRSGPGSCRRARPTRRPSRACSTGWPPGAAARWLIGVHEGAASLVLVAGLPQGADLHLVDPFGEARWWEPADEHAVKALVGRAAKRRGGPRLHWHVAPSPSVASDWSTPVDLVFIDGDHSREACRLDWDALEPALRSGGRGGLPRRPRWRSGADRGGDRAVRRRRPARAGGSWPSATRSSPSSGSPAGSA